ncbi:MAG TPA: TonB-dependent receptor, partial [Chthoniobacterales bacterium]
LFQRNEIRWTPWFRSIFGLRADLYNFDVDSNLAANSGDVFDGIVSPKLNLVFGLWDETEFYLNVGSGFHSNDARGVTASVSPSTDEPLKPAAPPRSLEKRRDRIAHLDRAEPDQHGFALLSHS